MSSSPSQVTTSQQSNEYTPSRPSRKSLSSLARWLPRKEFKSKPHSQSATMILTTNLSALKMTVTLKWPIASLSPVTKKLSSWSSTLKPMQLPRTLSSSRLMWFLSNQQFSQRRSNKNQSRSPQRWYLKSWYLSIRILSPSWYLKKNIFPSQFQSPPPLKRVRFRKSKPTKEKTAIRKTKPSSAFPARPSRA